MNITEFLVYGDYRAYLNLMLYDIFYKTHEVLYFYVLFCTDIDEHSDVSMIKV